MHTIGRTTAKHDNIICGSVKAKVIPSTAGENSTLRGEEQQCHLFGVLFGGISTVCSLEQDLILYLKNICSV